MCVCVCVCVCRQQRASHKRQQSTAAHSMPLTAADSHQPLIAPSDPHSDPYRDTRTSCKFRLIVIGATVVFVVAIVVLVVVPWG